MNAKDNLNAMNEIGNKGMERMNMLGELNMRVWEKLASRQMEAMNFMMEQSMRQMKLATESKGYSEFVKGQVELAKETSERMMEETPPDRRHVKLGPRVGAAATAAAAAAAALRNSPSPWSRSQREDFCDRLVLRFLGVGVFRDGLLFYGW